MRTICFDGEFGYENNRIFNGFIIFCHFEPNDKETNIKRLIRKIKTKERIILVPFAHLHEKIATKSQAENLFNILNEKCKADAKLETIKVPFGIDKEYLYTKATSKEIKFMRF